MLRTFILDKNSDANLLTNWEIYILFNEVKYLLLCKIDSLIFLNTFEFFQNFLTILKISF